MGPTADATIRQYEDRDRDAVRHICFETGYMGDPVAWLWRDETSWADLFTGYYTDQEPESALVAEVDGRVVGYLLGCRDTTRAGHPMAPLGRHIVRRGLFFRPGTAGLLWRAVGDLSREVLRGRIPSTPEAGGRWPAHLHIDFLVEGRGRGLGSTMVRQWFDTLRDEGIPGCHLGTWAENSSAIAFFEAMGLRRVGGTQPMPGVRSPTGGRHHSQAMVIDLAEGSDRSG